MLRRIPFHLNSNVFHFDTEIIIQLVLWGARVREVPIPTYYGDEISHVNGLVYAKDAVVACLEARAQEFTWAASAEAHLVSYQRAAEQRAE